MHSLLIATNNAGKLREFRELLHGLRIQLVTPSMMGLKMEVEETGSTYAENAALKAEALCNDSGLITLADDSGLEVDALDGAPGLHSARFHPKPGANDADRRAYLLEQLNGKPQPWKAHFHCTVAIAVPGQPLRFFEGNCPGEIIPQERGSNGFGYDPIFFVPEYGQTMAELGMEVKNQISHRARAAQAAFPFLSDLLND